MEMFFLIEFTNTHIIIAVLYGLASLILGIGFGYAINSKYKRQVVELERNKAKLNSSISNLEADIEEGKKARSNANGEISLLRNQLRDRESRLRETEGKVAIYKRKLEDEVKKQSIAEVKTPEVKAPETKKTNFFGSTPVTKPKVVVEKKIEAPASTMKLVKEDKAEIVEPVKPKAKKSKAKKAKAKAKASSSDSKVKSDKKRGRPAGSKNKSKETKSQDSKSSSGKKRGRPAGSKNKTTASASATKEVAPKKSTAKRGRPAGSKNTTTVAKTSTPATPKRRGRPAGSKNKSAASVTPKVASTGKRGRPAGTKNKATASVGRKKQDLTLIEGIGPKIQELLREGGIKTYNKMSKTLPKKLKDILVKDSARYNRVSTDSWPKQAKLAAEGKMDELKKLQDILDRGK